MRRVLFVVYGGGHAPMLIPVAKALQQIDGIDVVFFGVTTARSQAEKSGLKAVSYRDFKGLVGSDQSVEKWGLQLCEGSTHPEMPLEETIRYHGINFWHWVEAHGEDAAFRMWKEEGRGGFLPLQFFRRVIDRIRPDLVINSCMVRSELAAVTAAKEAGIASMTVLDTYGFPSEPVVSSGVKADRTCVIAPFVTDNLVTQGFAAESICVTGNPVFDALLRPEVQSRASQFIAQRGWQGKKVILWAGNHEPVAHPDSPEPTGLDFPIRIEQTLRAFVATREDLALIVRYHPNLWHAYPRQADSARVFFNVPTEVDVHTVIRAADVVVVQNSYVGVEAAVAGVPVVSVESSPAVKVWYSYQQMGISRGSPDLASLTTHVADVLAGGKAGSMPRFDGRCTERVVTAALSLI